ncbi:unnamed protein product, partial [Phaeothamnion confervicola]
MAARTGAGSSSGPPLSLDRVLGQTCLGNSALAVNPATGDVAYPAGCVVVVYQPRRNRQIRYFRAGKAVSCLAFSRDGAMLAVGERGHQPSVIVWDTATGAVLRELKGGHRFGVGCLAFSPRGHLLVTCGFKYDRTLQIWELGLRGDDDAQAGDGAWAAHDHLNGHANGHAKGHRGPAASPAAPQQRQRPGTAPAGRARRAASARIGQKVRAIDFAEDGTYFVTCGDRHVKFWFLDDRGNVPYGSGGSPAAAVVAAGDPTDPVAAAAAAAAEPAAAAAAAAAPLAILEGRPASILEALKDAVFMDVACSRSAGGGGGVVYCVTSAGLLCVFSAGRVMEQWLSLEAPAAYALSLCDDGDGTLAVACADGLVRLFAADSLRYVATLPRPPPLGRANVASMAELHAMTAVIAAGSNGTVTTAAGENNGGSDAAAAAAAMVRYPAALAVRMLPVASSGAKVVVAYADRGLFIWDAADPHNVGKYRSFL